MQRPSLSHIKYRADIDGLRALAVLGVVAFHAFPGRVRGGFIGVDVFFVISGYLISTIIFENLDNGTFSFSHFYARRIKRIFPALLLVLVACFIFGWICLLPSEYKQLGKHILGGSTFVSNFILWREFGYFDAGSDFKPLRHLWSLGVEEQFYIIWPLLSWVAYKKRFNLLVLILSAALLSFFLNINEVKSDSVGDFYSPQTRFWELMFGSTLAWLMLYVKDLKDKISSKSNSFISSLMSILGSSLLVFGFLWIDKDVGFPGAWALIPVSGSFLIILSGPKALVNRTVFSNKIAVWLGLISFPLYLWHWPLLSFAHIINGGIPSAIFRIMIIVISVILSWATFKLVEKPIRNISDKFSMVKFLIIISIILGLLGSLVFYKDGVLLRINTSENSINNSLNEKIAVAWVNRGYPTPPDFTLDPDYKVNKIGSSADNKILFIGDSHAQQYWNTISKIYSRLPSLGKKVSTLFYTDWEFPPTNFDRRILEDHKIKTVIFSYFWSYHYGSSSVNMAVRCCGNGADGKVGYFDIPFSDKSKMDLYDDQFIALIKEFKKSGKDVYIILDNPFGEEIDPLSMYKRYWNHLEIIDVKPLTKDSVLTRMNPVRNRLISIANLTGARFIDPVSYLCGKIICDLYNEDGELMYKDYDHLSLHTSQNFVKYLDFLYK